MDADPMESTSRATRVNTNIDMIRMAGALSNSLSSCASDQPWVVANESSKGKGPLRHRSFVWRPQPLTKRKRRPLSESQVLSDPEANTGPWSRFLSRDHHL